MIFYVLLAIHSLLKQTYIFSLKHFTFLKQIKTIHIVIYGSDHEYLNVKEYHWRLFFECLLKKYNIIAEMLKLIIFIVCLVQITVNATKYFFSPQRLIQLLFSISEML